MIVRPISMLIPSERVIANIDQHVENSKADLANLIKSGGLEVTESQIFVYRIRDPERSYLGLILGVDIQMFKTSCIVHHERTMPLKVEKQATIAQEQGGFSKPILLTHREIPEVANLIQKTILDKPVIKVFLKKYDSEHALWPITALEDLQIISAAYAMKRNAYIVDGHHRTQALLHLATDHTLNIHHGMCAMFAVDQLQILPFHRILDLDDQFEEEHFIAYLRNHGRVSILEKSRFPRQKHEIIFLTNDKTIGFIWDSSSIELNTQSLDVNFVSDYIFDRYWGIKNERNSTLINYLEGIYDLAAIHLKINNLSKMAILLHPIAIDEMIEITSNGVLLPPKSTYFLPRMANGIVGIQI